MAMGDDKSFDDEESVDEDDFIKAFTDVPSVQVQLDGSGVKNFTVQV